MLRIIEDLAGDWRRLDERIEGLSSEDETPVKIRPASDWWRCPLRALFVQAAWVVLVRIKCWERYGLKSWIEAAKKRLHHNVLAIALANKLARIAWAVLNKGRAFECVKTEGTASRPAWSSRRARGRQGAAWRR
jgi:hypothetical protein